MYFALVDQTAFALVQEFDRVLDSEDMAFNIRVEMVDHGRQRGGFARAGGPGHQHQPTRNIDDFAEYRRSADILQFPHRVGNGTERAAQATVLVETVDTETC